MSKLAQAVAQGVKALRVQLRKDKGARAMDDDDHGGDVSMMDIHGGDDATGVVMIDSGTETADDSAAPTTEGEQGMATKTTKKAQKKAQKKAPKGPKGPKGPKTPKPVKAPKEPKPVKAPKAAKTPKRTITKIDSPSKLYVIVETSTRDGFARMAKAENASINHLMNLALVEFLAKG